MHPHVRRTIAVVCLLQAVSEAAGAQSPRASRSTTEGWFLNAHLNGSSLTIDDVVTDESGGGGGLQVGYGFTRTFSLYIASDVASVRDREPNFRGDYSLSQFDIGARFNFANRARIVTPYFDLALTGRRFAADVTLFGLSGDAEWQGGGVSAGGGLAIHTSPRVAIDIGVKFTGGEFTDLEINGASVSDQNRRGSGARLNLGVTWYPGGPR
jgi:hypothetical protein